MNRQKALLRITGTVIAGALLLLVSAPRIAKGQGQGSPITLVVNPSGAPVYAELISQLPSQMIGLVCRENGEPKILSCEQRPFNPNASTTFTPYELPSSAFLVVTEVEIHDGNGTTASLTCSPLSSSSYGIWEASGAVTTQYLIPEGLTLPPGCAPTVTLNKALAGTEIFLRGYMPTGLLGN